MRINYIALWILLLSITGQAFGQGIVRGKIVDDNNLPLPGAIITIDSIDRGAVAKSDGTFIIQNLPEGTYELRSSYIGYNWSGESVERTAYQVVKQTISITTGSTVIANIQLKQERELEEVVIWDYSNSQAKALSQQKNTNKILNVISADQVGRFPDSNIGDALKRVPSIYVQYDQGEARFVNIRGASPDMNAVTIDGERIPSAEGENRTVQLDLIPSDMIQAIEVNKSVTPDMDADAIGASINLVTRSAPFKRRVSATLGSGYNMLSGKPMVNGSVIYGDRFLHDKVGLMVSGSVFNHNLGSDNIEAEWDENNRLKDFQVNQYYLRRLRQSYSLGLDYEINNNHTLFLKGLYNHRNDWENRYRLRYDGLSYDSEQGTYMVDEIQRETKGGSADNNFQRLEEQKVYYASLSGEHIFGKLIADWGLSYSKATEKRPNERYLSHIIEGQTVNFDLSDTNAPMPDNFFNNLSDSWEINYMSNNNKVVEEDKITGRINFLLSLNEGLYSSKLKFGGKYKLRSKFRDTKGFNQAPTDTYASTFNADRLSSLADLSKSNYLAGDYPIGNFVSKTFLGGLDFSNENNFETSNFYRFTLDNLEASEIITAGYAMIDQKLGKHLDIIAGVRVEHTYLEYSGIEAEGWDIVWNDDGNEITNTDVSTNSYINILPSINAKYSINESAIIRLAWTNTLNRPRYADLVPYEKIDRSRYLIGNSSLDPTKSMNFDLLGEYYFKSVGILSGGIFYKSMSDIIVPKTTQGVSIEGQDDTFRQIQPINGGNAQVLGFELALQRRLDFLPAPFNGLSIYSNYTFTDSQIENFQLEGREEDKLTLPGTAQHTLNASLLFESKRFSAGLLFNMTSAFAVNYSENASEDIYYDKVTYLDANASYKVTPQLNVYVEANNLLNQPLRYYQGSVDYVHVAEYYGSRFSIGAKFDL